MDTGTGNTRRSWWGWALACALPLAVAAPAANAEEGRPRLRSGYEVASLPAANCVTEEEAELGRLINEYRAQHDLPPVPLSRSLTKVAKSHVFDLAVNKPLLQSDPSGLPCSLHSWSDAGPWTSVCYTRDHAYADQMWSKPREVTASHYRGNGYENAYWTSRPLTARLAFEAWKRSPGHNALMIQSGEWGREPWAAMGFALSEHYAVVWFGDETDALGETRACQSPTDAFLRTASLSTDMADTELVASSRP